uniref:Uncharacterized protein n=2 Tax=Aliivibrio wodanis TaxID=80852 RepID=A0A5Q4ZY92_9GAMM|nr:hypothetical protein AW0309160_04331 [Aliivibrio wodanis]
MPNVNLQEQLQVGTKAMKTEAQKKLVACIVSFKEYVEKSDIQFSNNEQAIAHYLKNQKSDFSKKSILDMIHLLDSQSAYVTELQLMRYQRDLHNNFSLDNKIVALESHLAKKGIFVVSKLSDSEAEAKLKERDEIEAQKMSNIHENQAVSIELRSHCVVNLIALARHEIVTNERLHAIAANWVRGITEDADIQAEEDQDDFEEAYATLISFVAEVLEVEDALVLSDVDMHLDHFCDLCATNSILIAANDFRNRYYKRVKLGINEVKTDVPLIRLWASDYPDQRVLDRQEKNTLKLRSQLRSLLKKAIEHE